MKRKLTEKEVQRIRKMHKQGYSPVGIHTLFSRKVTVNAIRDIVNEKTWKTDPN
jgi:hypothetical protein